MSVCVNFHNMNMTPLGVLRALDQLQVRCCVLLCNVNYWTKSGPVGLSPPGPGVSDSVGRPPVLPAVLCTVSLWAGALHWRLLRQRGVPGCSEEGSARRTHLQRLPHPLPAPQRSQSLCNLPQVSWFSGVDFMLLQTKSHRHTQSNFCFVTSTSWLQVKIQYLTAIST